MKTIDYELIAEDHRIRLGMIVLQSDVRLRMNLEPILKIAISAFWSAAFLLKTR